MTSADRRPDLPALTSLRFFAAFYVVLFHGAQHLAHSDIAHSFVSTGFVAVDLFFVLSGFVLAYRYCNDNGELAATKRDFWVARLARIYPVYVLAILVGAPLYVEGLLATHSKSSALVLGAASLAATLLLLQSWFYRTATAWNTPAWSLSVEAFLYLSFPWLMPRIARWVGASTGRAVVLGGALWLLALAPSIAYVATNPDHLTAITHGSGGRFLDTLRFTPLFHLASFALGIVAGTIHLRRAGTVPSWLTALVAVALIATLCAGEWLPYPLVHTGLFSPLFAMLVFCLAGDRGWFGKALGARPLVVLGDASYALYLLHFPALQYAGRLLGTPLSLLQLAAVCVVLQVACLVVYRVVEVPARGAIRRRLSVRRSKI